jgi:hypothetical protein
MYRSPSGHYTMVDIWGYDSYPNGASLVRSPYNLHSLILFNMKGFDCSHPYTWGANAVPASLYTSYLKYAPPETPNAVYEYQGGAFDGWGGTGYGDCAVRSFYIFESYIQLTSCCKSGFARSRFRAGVLQKSVRAIHDTPKPLHDLRWHELGWNRPPWRIHVLRLRVRDRGGPHAAREVLRAQASGELLLA